MSAAEGDAGRHADEQSAGPRAKPSVFGVPDQDDVIARIDAVTEDDLTSGFFDDSIQDVEEAATRVFDIGVRTMSHDGAPDATSGAFGPPGSTTSQSRASAPPESLAGLTDDDPSGRRAFILGGPAAIRRG